MRRLALLTLVSATVSAAAAPRRLSLAEAVQLAMRVDPLVAETRVADERAKLGVLRAELDRFRLKVDGSLQELWNKYNIGGPTLSSCSDPTIPSSLCGQPFGPITLPGMLVKSRDQQPSQWLGLSNFQAELDYFLFSGFYVEANVKRARASEKAFLAQVRQQRKDTAIAVARAYYAVKRAIILRDVSENALARLADAESIAAGRVRAGLAPPIDKNSATQRKLAQQAVLEDLRGQARAALAQLGVMLAIGDDIELTDEPQIPEVVPASVDELVAQAMKRRPEIANANLQVDAQHQQVWMARSGFYPKITLLGLFQYGNNQFNLGTGARSLGNAANPFTNLSGQFTVGAQLTMSFFDTLNTYTATGDAYYYEKWLRQDARRVSRLVDGDVRTTHANLQKLFQKRQPLVAARDIAADNLKIQEGRYKNGDALIIEYLNAQVDLANAERDLADVTAQLALQWYELEAALGLTVGVDHGS